jgi:PAS domain S-box-containing protein
MTSMNGQDKTREHLKAELEQLRSELRALPKREEVWQRLLQSFPNGSVNIFDKELRYLLAEGTGIKHVGLAPEDLVGKTIAEAFPEQDAAFVAPYYRRALEGETVEFELPFRKHLYSINAGPLRDEHGDIYAIVAIAQDITARRHAEEALHNAEVRAIKEYERLLGKLAHLGAAIGAARDLQTIFRALREFGVTSVPCIGIFISLYDPARDVRTAVYAWGDGAEIDVSALPPMPITTEGPNSRAVRTGEVVITDDFLNVKHGHPTVAVGEDNGLFPQSTLVVPMAFMGRIVGTIEVQSYEPAAYKEGHVTVMSMAANLAAVAVENVRLFEHESRARAVAEESNRIKDEFLATLSHELRTPLTAMLGWTRMLRTGELDNLTAEHALEIIERNARAQEQIIEDILDVSRIITGRVRLEVRPLRLEPLIEAALDAARPAADARGIELQLSCAAPSGFVSGDPDRLQQVIWNLLSNAVKFTSQGGRVDVTLKSVDSQAQIEVKDTGQGISAEFLPYVFDRFRQADGSTTRAHGGLGLGLAIVRHLVELHGGDVRATRERERPSPLVFRYWPIAQCPPRIKMLPQL